jgi:hypothetical protein
MAPAPTTFRGMWGCRESVEGFPSKYFNKDCGKHCVLWCGSFFGFLEEFGKLPRLFLLVLLVDPQGWLPSIYETTSSPTIAPGVAPADDTNGFFSVFPPFSDSDHFHSSNFETRLSLIFQLE